MGRAKTLSETEKAQVDTLNENYSIREIARRLKQSDYATRNYLYDKENYGRKRKGQTARTTTELERRKMIRIASNSAATAHQIRDAAGTSASVRTVQRVLKQSPHIRRLKLKKNREDWKKVVFTDEKLLSFDEPEERTQGDIAKTSRRRRCYGTGCDFLFRGS
ncbi:hypothetical protein Trydic_g16785 [Trypoxylus dichotomus]